MARNASHGTHRTRITALLAALKRDKLPASNILQIRTERIDSPITSRQ